MLTNFRVGDRVEDKKTHKRGRITFVYSELERKGEVIEVLFDGRDEVVDVPADDVREVSTRRSKCRTHGYKQRYSSRRDDFCSITLASG
jgi:hypothetical protein